MRHFVTVLAIFAMPAALAGMYDQPYAIVESGSPSETRKELLLVISRVDGQSLRNMRKSDPLAPGKHIITVQISKSRFNEQTRDIEIDLQACTRYRFVAKLETASALDWKPKIYTEPIGECVRKFKK